MRIIEYYNHPSEIPGDQLQKSFQRKWYSWNPTYIIQSEGKVALVSLNFFERLAHILFGIDYFKDVFGGKNVTLISPSTHPSFKKNTIASPSSKKPIVDVLLTSSAGDYEIEVMNIVYQIAKENFGQKFDNTESLHAYLTAAKNSKRVLIIFVSTQPRHNFDTLNKTLSSLAEAVGHQGRVVFEVLKHNDASITSRSIKNMLFGKSANFPISKEYQNRIEIFTYLRAGALTEEVSKQMGDDLKELLNRL